MIDVKKNDLEFEEYLRLSEGSDKEACYRNEVKEEV